jgi:hypothetical protein
MTSISAEKAILTLLDLIESDVLGKIRSDLPESLAATGTLPPAMAMQIQRSIVRGALNGLQFSLTVCSNTVANMRLLLDSIEGLTFELPVRERTDNEQ